MSSDVSVNICRFDGRRCDISGNYIERGEPFLSIFNIDIKNRNVEEKIDKLRENTIKCERVDSSGNVYGKCAICEEHGETLRLKVKNESAGFLLCDNCLDEISESAVEKSQEIDKKVHYWNSSGVCIFERGIFEGTFIRDNISGNEIKYDDVTIMIVIYDSCFYCSIYNIENLIEVLKQGKPCSNRSLCDRCRGTKSDIQSIKSSFMMCGECRRDILEILEEYVENNRSFIISRTI